MYSVCRNIITRGFSLQTSRTLSLPKTVFFRNFSDSHSDLFDDQKLVEPSFTSLGLNHGWPSGWIQNALELCHLHCELPWWQCIVTTTVVLRVLMFPLIIKCKKSMVHVSQHQPTMFRLQNEAVMAETPEKKKLKYEELSAYMNLHNVHPLKTQLPMLSNGIIVASTFFAIRGMVHAPVESLAFGGTLWFPNLLESDPLYILPALVSAFGALQVKMGADGMDSSGFPPIVIKCLYVFPLLLFPTFSQFSSALVLYIATNNCISVLQAFILKRKGIQKYFGIGSINHEASQEMMKHYKKSWNDFKEIRNQIRKQESK